LLLAFAILEGTPWAFHHQQDVYVSDEASQPIKTPQGIVKAQRKCDSWASPRNHWAKVGSVAGKRVKPDPAEQG
jgi:hypothetical protein